MPWSCSRYLVFSSAAFFSGRPWSEVCRCDLPDNKLPSSGTATGPAVIREELGSFRPDLVVTLHKDGISGHPDPRAVARWCLEAVRENSGPRLLGYGITEAQARRVGFRELRPIPDGEITHVIDVSDYLEHKLRAIECHKSQSEFWDKLRSVPGGYVDYARREYFSQAWPAPGPGRAPAGRLEE